MKISFKLIVITLLCYTKTTAQEILWEKSYGGNNSDLLSDIVSTPDNGFIIIGNSISENSGNKKSKTYGDYDTWIVKIDDSGEIKWQKTIGGDKNDFVKKIILTNDGGFLLGLNSNSTIINDKKINFFGLTDLVLVKLDAFGEIEWTKTLGGNFNDEINDIKQNIDGGFIIGGSTDSNRMNNSDSKFYGGRDYLIYSLDKKGEIIWEKRIGGQFDDIIKVIEIIDENTIMVAGSSNSPTDNIKTSDFFGNNDGWIIELDKLGDIKNQFSIGGSGDDDLISFIKTNEGFLIGFTSNSINDGNKKVEIENGTDLWLVHTDNKLNSIWQKIYDKGKVDILNNIIKNDNNTYSICTYTKSEIKLGKNAKRNDKEGVNDYRFITINDNGELIWEKVLGSKGEDILIKGIKLRDNSYLLAGVSNPLSSKFIDSDYSTDSKAINKESKVINSKNKNQFIDNNVNDFNKDLQNEISKSSNNVSNKVNDVNKSPFKLGINDSAIKTGIGNGEDKNSNPNYSKSTVSRDKNTNFGNYDYWITKFGFKDKEKKLEFSIETYPNPTSGKTNIIIGYDYDYGTLIIADLAGHILHKQEVQNTKTIPLNLSNFAEGIYIVSLKTNKEENSIKIIKNNNSK